MQQWHISKIAHLQLALQLSSTIQQLHPTIMASKGYFSTKNCAGIFRCSCYIFYLNRSAKSKCQFLSCATVECIERYFLLRLIHIYIYTHKSAHVTIHISFYIVIHRSFCVPNSTLPERKPNFAEFSVTTQKAVPDSTC
jgi:hypothetical protein